MNFVRRLGWTFASPRSLFEDIREDRTTWWQPWIWLSLLYGVFAHYEVPISMAVMETNPNNLPLAELDTQLVYMERYASLQVIGTPVALLFVGLIVCGITYVAVSLLSESATFKRYFTMALYASVIAGISNGINAVVVHARGIENIRSASDAAFSLSLRFLAPADNSLLEAVLSSIELFGLWGLVFLAMGFVHVFGMSPTRAVIAVLPWWLLTVALTILGQGLGAIG